MSEPNQDESAEAQQRKPEVAQEEQQEAETQATDGAELSVGQADRDGKNEVAASTGDSTPGAHASSAMENIRNRLVQAEDVLLQKSATIAATSDAATTTSEEGPVMSVVTSTTNSSDCTKQLIVNESGNLREFITNDMENLKKRQAMRSAGAESGVGVFSVQTPLVQHHARGGSVASGYGDAGANPVSDEDTTLIAEIAPDFDALEEENNVLKQQLQELEEQRKTIVVANTVQSEDGDNTDNDHANSTRSKQSRRKVAAGVVAAIVIIVVVIVLVVVLTRDDKPFCGFSSKVDTSTPRYLALRDLFGPLYNETGIENDDEEAENNPNRLDSDPVRQRALHWLANEDPAQMDIPGMEVWNEDDGMSDNSTQQLQSIVPSKGSTIINNGLSLMMPSSLEFVQLLQRYIIALVYFSTSGTCWTSGVNWLSVYTVCRWENVICDPNKLLHVRELDLASTNLQGTIPDEISFLTHLDRCDLASNELTGTIPTQYGQLTKLRDLSFGTNQLSGMLPSEMGNLADLFFFSCTLNDLQGAIPSELGRLSALEQLFIAENDFTGTVPLEIADLPLLHVFHNHGNELTGDLDDIVCNETDITIPTADVVSDCLTEVHCSCCRVCCDDKQCCDRLPGDEWKCAAKEY